MIRTAMVRDGRSVQNQVGLAGGLLISVSRFTPDFRLYGMRTVEHRPVQD
jgi:hypothetical protein